jgi:hypothetical protein
VKGGVAADHDPVAAACVKRRDDVPGAVQAIIFMDTHVVSPADGGALLRGLEAAAVQAALDPAAPTAVPPTA